VIDVSEMLLGDLGFARDVHIGSFNEDTLIS